MIHRKTVFFLITLLLLVFLFTGAITNAQGDPTPQINAALADLSQRAGTTITLDDLSSWNWTQSNYPDTSLGCAQAGQTYSQVVTSGYRITMVYNGVNFDYRATANNSIFFLCSGPATISPVQVQPTAVPAQSQTNTTTTTTTTGQAVCAGAMNTQLRSGVEGRVRTTGLPVNVRSTFSADAARVAQMSPGETFSVVGGPECAENLVWWQVRYGQITGWAAEGANSVYWIEPTGSTSAATTAATTTGTVPTPQGAQVYSPAGNLPVISAASAAQLDRMVELPLNESLTSLTWSPDGQFIAATGTSGLYVYNALALRTSPRVFQVPNGPTLDAAFNPDGTFLATAHNDTGVRVWDLSVGGLRALLRGHTQPVWAVAFSPNGRLLASASGKTDAPGDDVVRLWDISTQSQITVLAGHTAPVTAVAFNPDGTLLASASEDNTVRLWDVASASPGTVLPNHSQPVRAVAFSPDGAWLASGGDSGTIQLWQIGPGTQSTLEAENPISALVFSPDGSLLITAGRSLNGVGDSRIQIWDLATSTLLATLDTFGAAPDAAITGLAFNPSGTLLAAAVSQTNSGIVRIFGAVP